MSLPIQLELAVESLCEGVKEKELSRAVYELTERYKQAKSHQTDMQRLAYLCVRMPATYSVLNRVFQEFEVPQTVIDCGAGPGTSLWALPGHEITLIEKDAAFVRLGKTLAPHSKNDWKSANFLHFQDRAEMILFSYSLNEVPREHYHSIIDRAYEQTEDIIAVIEPGTPEGFERVRNIRSQLIDKGMSILAPCTHSQSCPMQHNNWCHFSVRLPRTSMHRRLKKGSLGYEDEKFSYVVGSKQSFKATGARVLRKPLKRKGHSLLKLCDENGLEVERLTKLKNIKVGDLIL